MKGKGGLARRRGGAEEKAGFPFSVFRFQQAR